MNAALLSGLLLAILVAGVFAGEALPLPPRQPDAPTGSALLKRIELAPVEEREAVLAQEILAGNVPDHLRALCPVLVEGMIEGKAVAATIYVTSDYLAVGHDDDFLLTPLRPATAQRIADRLNCLLPTPHLVDAIYRSSSLKLPPHPLPPGPAMTTFSMMADHSRIVGLQRFDALLAHPFGTLTAGHKKDIVLTPSLRNLPGKVAIYGWHRLDAVPIQPLYTGHTAGWVDYSHGIRLVSQKIIIGGKPHRLPKALADPQWSPLFSPEGPIEHPRYPIAPRPRGGVRRGWNHLNGRSLHPYHVSPQPGRLRYRVPRRASAVAFRHNLATLASSPDELLPKLLRDHLRELCRARRPLCDLCGDLLVAGVPALQAAVVSS